ncbi:hypothetical protein Mapa_009746 [Marchantia paleacea]|nr:hypothetical protein Mapa_009746 [Marchantia paleacea]
MQLRVFSEDNIPLTIGWYILYVLSTRVLRQQFPSAPARILSVPCIRLVVTKARLSSSCGHPSGLLDCTHELQDLRLQLHVWR